MGANLEGQAMKSSPQTGTDTDPDFPATNFVEESKLFLEFHYPEVKDLAKHFLTLNSGLLVFSVAFAEKIVGLPPVSGLGSRGLLFSWSLLIVALVSCGSGLYVVFLAAERAKLSIALRRDMNLGSLVRPCYLLLDLSGICFVSGLVILVLSAVPRFL
jgi:hypothetical protein